MEDAPAAVPNPHGIIVRLPSASSRAIRGAVVIPSLARAVEELVLNSLDSGATRIDVCVVAARRLENSGGASVEIRDNGAGISPACFRVLGMPGASSKALQAAAVSSSQSYGHRGEALAALCAVAGRVVITSKMRARGPATAAAAYKVSERMCDDADCGTWQKVFECGEAVRCGLCDSLQGRGTTVLIEGLLDALPVRRRSLFADVGREVAAARRRIERIALLHPKVRFKYQPIGGAAHSLFREQIELPLADDIVERLEQVMGIKLRGRVHQVGDPGLAAEQCEEFRGMPAACGVNGIISLPHDPQASDRFMFLFINGRLVEHTPVHEFVSGLYLRCAQDAAGVNADGPVSMAAAATGRAWPMFVMNIRCAPDAYDIGYSPDRTHVEFRDWRAPLVCVRSALHQLFRTATPLYVPSLLETPGFDTRAGASVPYYGDGKLATDVLHPVGAFGACRDQIYYRHNHNCFPNSEARGKSDDRNTLYICDSAVASFPKDAGSEHVEFSCLDTKCSGSCSHHLGSISDCGGCRKTSVLDRRTKVAHFRRVLEGRRKAAVHMQSSSAGGRGSSSRSRTPRTPAHRPIKVTSSSIGDSSRRIKHPSWIGRRFLSLVN